MKKYSSAQHAKTTASHRGCTDLQAATPKTGDGRTVSSQNANGVGVKTSLPSSNLALKPQTKEETAFAPPSQSASEKSPQLGVDQANGDGSDEDEAESCDEYSSDEEGSEPGTGNDDGWEEESDDEGDGTPPSLNACNVFDKMSEPTKASNSYEEAEVFRAQQGNGDARADLPKNNPSLSGGINLRFLKSTTEEVILPEKAVDNVKQAWEGRFLMGCFAANYPGKQAVLQICDSWGVEYEQFHLPKSNWLMIFKFANEDDCERVLNGGPYFVKGRQLVLKSMPPFFESDDIKAFKFMPAWIKLPGLPLECWSEMALSLIVSKIGKPIETDKRTRTKERIAHARVLVEVDASKKLIRSVKIKLPNGKLRIQPVDFEYEPKFCTSCMALGHLDGACPPEETSEQRRNRMLWFYPV